MADDYMDARKCDKCGEHYWAGERHVCEEVLTFGLLQAANSARAKEVFKMCESWSIADWYMALVGEMGELGNLLKKRNRGERVSSKAVADEIADIQIYLDLIATQLFISLGKATVSKFNEVSIKRNSMIKLPSWEDE